MELVSVIVPIYNVDKYLNKCIESIVNQSYKNLEILLINDGSSDDSPKICDDWTKKDSRIIVIHKNNGGLSSARNTGINVSKGKYLCFIDSDDFIASDFICTLYNSINSNNADIAMCELSEIDENYKTTKSNNKRVKILNGIYSGKSIIDKICKNYIFTYVIACNKMYKKELFLDLRYKEGKTREDEFIIHHLLAKSEKVNCITTPLYFYLRRNNSIIGQGFNLKTLDGLEALQDRISFFNSKKWFDLSDIASHKLVRNAIDFIEEIKQASSISIEDANNAIANLEQIIKQNIKKLIKSKNLSLRNRLTLLIYFISPKLFSLLNLIKNIFFK